MTTPRPLVLVTSRSFGSGSVDLVRRIADAGYDVVRASPAHRLEELAGTLPRAVGWIAGTGPIRAEHLELAPGLRVIARYGVGVDTVDLAAAESRGIVVTNTPGANATAVVEHTLALLLTALRGIPAANLRVRAGDWSGWRARELSALTVGIVGLGRIGHGVADRLAAFGARLLGHDPMLGAGNPAFGIVRRADLEEIARAADVVTLHAPGGATLLDERWFALDDRPQIVVNTARAELVDEAALAAALRSGRCSAYATDTLASENMSADSPLLVPELADRVTVTPHVAAQTLEGIDAMGTMATQELLAVLSGREPRSAVTRTPALGGSLADSA